MKTKSQRMNEAIRLYAEVDEAGEDLNLDQRYILNEHLKKTIVYYLELAKRFYNESPEDAESLIEYFIDDLRPHDNPST